MKRLSARTHTDTHKRTEHRQLPQCVSSLLAGGSRVDAAWKISTVIAAKPQPRKTYKFVRSQRLYTCVSAGSVWHGAWHYGAVIKEALDL